MTSNLKLLMENSVPPMHWMMSAKKQWQSITPRIYRACPPDTLITCPVSILAFSLAKNRIVSAISSG